MQGVISHYCSGMGYSSSKIVSFISGKSNNSDTIIPKPIASLCSVFSFGFFVFPDIIFSTVDCGYGADKTRALCSRDNESTWYV